MPPDNGIISSTQPLRTTLYEVEITIENTLKGIQPDSSLVYYFYGHPLNRAIMGLRPHNPGSGQRYVLMLREEHDRWRSVIDYASWPHLRVYSGYHSREFVSTNWSLNERIARIILSPGKEIDPREFEREIESIAESVDALVGPLGTLRILKSLLSDDRCVIRSSACVVLAQRYPGQESCLRAAARDACLEGIESLTAWSPSAMLTWSAEADRRAAVLASRIRQGDLREYSRTQQVAQEYLQLFAIHPNNDVSAAACEALGKPPACRRAVLLET